MTLRLVGGPERNDLERRATSGTLTHASRHSTGSIAASLPAELVGPSDLAITGVEGIDVAGPGELTFIRSHKFATHWAKSGASAALVSRGLEITGHDPSKRALAHRRERRHRDDHDPAPLCAPR